MNESAGDQISELLHNNDLDLTDADDLESTDEPDADEETPVRPREGLPGSFRMRHDAHYVDELLSRSSPVASAFDRDRPARSTARVVPGGRPDGSDASPRVEPSSAGPAAAALALIAARLESVVGQSDAAGPDRGASAVMARSVRVEFGRVARLARAAAVLASTDSPIRRSISAARIADRVRSATAAAARMAGLDYEVTLDEPAAAILAEPGLVVQAIAGTVDALVDLLLADPRRQSADDDGAAARLSISVQSVKIRPAFIIDVTCPVLFVGSAHAEQLFDPQSPAHRDAPSAGILLAAAAHIARAHGGRADVKPHSGVGVTITYVFPQVLSEYPVV